MKYFDVKAELEKRNLPPLRPRTEMIKKLLDEEYGYLPTTDIDVTTGKPAVLEARMCAGTAEAALVPMTVSGKNGTHTFNILRLVHNDGKKHPFFVHLCFKPEFLSFYFPIEEIAERGFDLFTVCYKDVSPDDGTFGAGGGLAEVLFGPDGRPEGDKTAAGKLRIWAYAASLVLNYALTRPSVDPKRAAVMGHSRLGKTALLAGMLDERFAFAFSNDSGCSGAALCRGNTGVTGTAGEYGRRGETIRDIYTRFPYWFCTNFEKYAEPNIPDGFDQHWLMASVAPRFAYAASADMDDWADPVSEYLCCAAASEAWEKQGIDGFVYDKNGLPEAGAADALQEGHVGYHKRHGKHFLSRFDWNLYMDYMEKHS